MNASAQQTIAREAGAWVSRLREDASSECHAGFDAWLRHSPRHVAEYLLATAASAELGAVDPERQIDLQWLLEECQPALATLPGRTDASPAQLRRRFVWSVAAAVVLAVSSALWFSGILRGEQYRTGVGEQREIKLADGSIVQLNTRSRIRVLFSDARRVVELSEGEALFTVAQEAARPFVVRGGPASVQAVGTQFNVHRRDTGALVSVLQGRVRIAASRSTPLLLDAGQEADVESTGRIVPVTPPDIEARMAWRQRRLEFRSATVAQIAAEFNRYNQTQIRIADAAVAARRMTGIFAADRPERLVEFLVEEGGVRIERRRGTISISSSYQRTD